MASNNSSVYNNSHISGQDIAFAVMYSFIVIIGVPANWMIVTIVRKTPSRHTTTNYLLMNLAVADLTTLLLCPGMYDFSLNKMRLDKTLGDFLCKFFYNKHWCLNSLHSCRRAIFRSGEALHHGNNIGETKSSSCGYIFVGIRCIILHS